VANPYGRPSGGFLDDYSGIAAAGAGFEGFVKGLQGAQDQKYKAQEFEAKMSAMRSQQEREAQELAIKKRQLDPQVQRREEMLKLAASNQEPIYGEGGELTGTQYKPGYMDILDKKASADPFGLKKTNAENAGLEQDKKKLDIAKEKKVLERSSKSPVVGYNKIDDSEIDVTSARQLKEASAELTKFNNQMSALEASVKSASTSDLANPLSDVSKDIKNKLRDLQLTYKSDAFAKLGVLTGPDLKLLEEVIENPGTVSNLLSGKSGVLSRYKSVKDRVGQNFNAKAEAYGLVPAGLVKKEGLVDGPPPAAPAPDMDAKKKRLEELRAKAAGGKP